MQYFNEDNNQISSRNENTREIYLNKDYKSRRNRFTEKKSFPLFMIFLIVLYSIVYFSLVYFSQNFEIISEEALSIFGVSSGEFILKGNYLALISNFLVHRSIWDFGNTIFIILFCGIFLERYVKKSVLILAYLISVVFFVVLSVFMYKESVYIGSFSIVSCFIGMSVYFSYRFKRFVMKIDIYIYIAFSVVCFILNYMILDYNVVYYIISYILGFIIIFILDTNALVEKK